MLQMVKNVGAKDTKSIRMKQTNIKAKMENLFDVNDKSPILTYVMQIERKKD
jgi:hypothetical protein